MHYHLQHMHKMYNCSESLSLRYSQVVTCTNMQNETNVQANMHQYVKQQEISKINEHNID